MSLQVLVPSQQRETNPLSILERKSKIEKKKGKKSVLLYFAFFIRYSLVISYSLHPVLGRMERKAVWS